MKAKNDLALKESTFALKLLGEGKTIASLREIDPTERGSRTGRAPREFFLFPGANLPTVAAIKPSTQDDLEAAMESTRSNMGMVKFRHYAVLRAVAKISNLKGFKPIQDEHPWVWTEIERRFERSPNKALFLWALRVYEMANPMILVERPMYDGQHHWVKLEAALATKGAKPVLPKDVFENRVNAIRSKLAEA